MLLQIPYTIRSARLLMEQLEDNLLFRWFVGLFMDDKVWDHSVFSKNQERFLDSDLAAALFARILEQAAAAGPHRRKPSKFSRALTSHKGTDILLKEEIQLNYSGFSTVC